MWPRTFCFSVYRPPKCQDTHRRGLLLIKRPAARGAATRMQTRMQPSNAAQSRLPVVRAHRRARKKPGACTHTRAKEAQQPRARDLIPRGGAHLPGAHGASCAGAGGARKLLLPVCVLGRKKKTKSETTLTPPGGSLRALLALLLLLIAIPIARGRSRECGLLRIGLLANPRHNEVAVAHPSPNGRRVGGVPAGAGHAFCVLPDARLEDVGHLRVFVNQVRLEEAWWWVVSQ